MSAQAFELARTSVTAREAAEAYGMEINRHGRALCIWHDDKNPSLSFKDGYCHCFACGCGGSSIDLTAQLFGITPAEAAQKIAEDFRLNTGAMDEKAIVVRKNRTAQRRELEEWARKRWAFLCDVEDEAQRVLASFPASEESWENPRFLRALQSLGRVQIELETLWLARETEELEAIRKVVNQRGAA